MDHHETDARQSVTRSRGTTERLCANEQTVVRCLKLLTYLSATFPVPASLLGADLGVTERTVRRDVALLRSAGYPILATPDGYVRDERRKADLLRVLGLGA